MPASILPAVASAICACCLSISATPSSAADVMETISFRDPSGDVSYVRLTPPAVLTETPPATLAQEQVWIPGHWAYQNGFFWRPGVIIQRPSGQARWMPGAWKHVATRHHGWRYVPGRWES